MDVSDFATKIQADWRNLLDHEELTSYAANLRESRESLELSELALLLEGLRKSADAFFSEVHQVFAASPGKSDVKVAGKLRMKTYLILVIRLARLAVQAGAPHLTSNSRSDLERYGLNDYNRAIERFATFCLQDRRQEAAQNLFNQFSEAHKFVEDPDEVEFLMDFPLMGTALATSSTAMTTLGPRIIGLFQVPLSWPQPQIEPVCERLTSSILAFLRKGEKYVDMMVPVFEVPQGQAHLLKEVMETIGNETPVALPRGAVSLADKCTAKFIGQMAETYPSESPNFLPFLAPLLQGSTSTVRKGVIQCMGWAAIEVLHRKKDELEAADEAAEVEKEPTIKEYSRPPILSALLDRTLDENVYCRIQAWRCLQELVRRGVLRFSEFPDFLDWCLPLVCDRSSLVRKEVILLAQLLLEANKGLFSSDVADYSLDCQNQICLTIEEQQKLEANVERLEEALEACQAKVPDADRASEHETLVSRFSESLAAENYKAWENTNKLHKLGLLSVEIDIQNRFRETLVKLVSLCLRLLDSKYVTDVTRALAFLAKADAICKNTSHSSKLFELVNHPNATIQDATVMAFYDLHLKSNQTAEARVTSILTELARTRNQTDIISQLEVFSKICHSDFLTETELNNLANTIKKRYADQFQQTLDQEDRENLPASQRVPQLEAAQWRQTGVILKLFAALCLSSNRHHSLITSITVTISKFKEYPPALDPHFVCQLIETLIILLEHPAFAHVAEFDAVVLRLNSYLLEVFGVNRLEMAESPYGVLRGVLNLTFQFAGWILTRKQKFQNLAQDAGANAGTPTRKKEGESKRDTQFVLTLADFRNVKLVAPNQRLKELTTLIYENTQKSMTHLIDAMRYGSYYALGTKCWTEVLFNSLKRRRLSRAAILKKDGAIEDVSGGQAQLEEQVELNLHTEAVTEMTCDGSPVHASFTLAKRFLGRTFRSSQMPVGSYVRRMAIETIANLMVVDLQICRDYLPTVFALLIPEERMFDQELMDFEDFIDSDEEEAPNSPAKDPTTEERRLQLMNQEMQEARQFFKEHQFVPDNHLKANLLVCLGDLFSSRPNLISPWCSKLYTLLDVLEPTAEEEETGFETRMRHRMSMDQEEYFHTVDLSETDRNEEFIRYKTLVVLTQVMKHDMLKPRGHLLIRVLERTVDESPRIREMARMFLQILGAKSSTTMFNLLPDLISRLCQKYAKSDEAHKAELFINQSLSFINKEKQIEGILQKLCVRIQSFAGHPEMVKFLSYSFKFLKVTSLNSILRFHDQCFQPLASIMAIDKNLRDNLGSYLQGVEKFIERAKSSDKPVEEDPESTEVVVEKNAEGKAKVKEVLASMKLRLKELASEHANLMVERLDTTVMQVEDKEMGRPQREVCLDELFKPLTS